MNNQTKAKLNKLAFKGIQVQDVDSDTKTADMIETDQSNDGGDLPSFKSSKSKLSIKSIKSKRSIKSSANKQNSRIQNYSGAEKNDSV